MNINMQIIILSLKMLSDAHYNIIKLFWLCCIRKPNFFWDWIFAYRFFKLSCLKRCIIIMCMPLYSEKNEFQFCVRTFVRLYGCVSFWITFPLWLCLQWEETIELFASFTFSIHKRKYRGANNVSWWSTLYVKTHGILELALLKLYTYFCYCNMILLISKLAMVHNWFLR